MRRVAAVAGLVLCAVILKCAGMKKQPQGPSRIHAKAPGAVQAGSSTCAGCHEDIFKKIEESKGVHRSVVGKPEAEAYCESCHGPGSLHAESMDPSMIFGGGDLASLSIDEQSRTCLSCHRTLKAGWTRSIHAGGVACWECHGDALHGTPSDFGIDTKPASTFSTEEKAFCGQCHEDVSMSFVLQYHHPVPEGKLACSSCHAVHGESDRIETAPDPASVCTACHEEMAGPWVFEHEAMNEGCQSCHEPHGSANRKLLVMQNNTLCLQCHVETSFPTIGGVNHDVFVGAGAACWECHTEVHGSNSSPGFNPGM